MFIIISPVHMFVIYISHLLCMFIDNFFLNNVVKDMYYFSTTV